MVEKNYFDCDVILTKDRLIVISDYTASKGIGTVFFPIFYAMNRTRDVLEVNPLININLSDVSSFVINEESFTSYRSLIVRTCGGIEHLFTGLTKHFVSEAREMLGTEKENDS